MRTGQESLLTAAERVSVAWTTYRVRGDLEPFIAAIGALRAAARREQLAQRTEPRCPECAGTGFAGCGSRWHDSRPRVPPSGSS